ncbi:MAG: transcriptional regulator [Rhodocyclaceae bacterium]|nr:transcriptional regulator [Rhodocyclaceae bacterium]
MMPTTEVFQYLKQHGQCLDSEVAVAMGLPLSVVTESLQALAAKKQVFMCSVTKYSDGQPIEAVQCRVGGYIPPVAPGRKPAAKR